MMFCRLWDPSHRRCPRRPLRRASRPADSRGRGDRPARGDPADRLREAVGGRYQGRWRGSELGLDRRHHARHDHRTQREHPRRLLHLADPRDLQGHRPRARLRHGLDVGEHERRHQIRVLERQSPVRSGVAPEPIPRHQPLLPDQPNDRKHNQPVRRVGPREQRQLQLDSVPHHLADRRNLRARCHRCRRSG